jgi:hypothetical protein
MPPARLRPRCTARSAVVAVVCLIISLGGPLRVAARPAAQGGPTGDQVAQSAVLDAAALGLHERRVGDRLLRVQEGVGPERVDWIARAWGIGLQVLPELTGLAPSADAVNLFIFADQPSFRRLTSQLTGLSPSAIQEFEAGRVFASGAHRGVYLNAATLTAPEQAARVVVHEMAHLAEKEAVGAHRLPAGFSEGLADYVGAAAMERVNPGVAAQWRWRRAALVASAIHRDVAIPLSAVETPRQWDDAVAAGYQRRAYGAALLAIDSLVTAAGAQALPRLLWEMARGASFPAALTAAASLTPADLDPSRAPGHAATWTARYPIGLHVFPAEGAPGTLFQFAAVGLPPGEVLTRQFVRADGQSAQSSGEPGAVAPSGAAFWTFWTRADGEPTTWTVTIVGDRGTQLALDFRVVAPASLAPANSLWPQSTGPLQYLHHLSTVSGARKAHLLSHS